MSWRAIRIASAALALGLGITSVAYAQDPIDAVLDKVIAGVELQIEGRPATTPELLAVVDIKPGERLTFDAWRRASDRLTQIPRFQSVKVLVNDQPDGLHLIFDLEPRHPIEQLEFVGETGLAPGEIERQVRSRFGGIPAPSQLNSVVDFVRSLLQGEGFESPAVVQNVFQTHDPDRATLVVSITAGARTVISRIAVEGNSALSREQILEQLKIATGGPFRRAAIDTEAAKLRESLRGEGYYTATVMVRDTLSPDGAQADLVVSIDTGPLVELRVVGPLPGKKDDLIPIKRDASVDQDLLDDSKNQIEREFRRQGYWKAAASFSQEKSDGNLIITFNVDRGKRYRIVSIDWPSSLQVQTNLQADPALQKGAVFNLEAVQVSLSALRALYLLQGFNQVKFDPKFDEVPGRNEGEGGVVIRPQITEGPRAVISQMTFDLGENPSVTEATLRGLMASDQQYFSDVLVRADRQVILDAYESLGFLEAQVQLSSEVNSTGTEAAVLVRAREGRRFTVGDVTVVGNDSLSREEILRASGLKPGMPYNETLRIDSQRRLYNTLAVQSVRVNAEPRLPGETETRLVISILEGGSITLSEGGGLEVGIRRQVQDGIGRDVFELAPRAFIEITRRNIGGHNRSVSLFARVGLKRRGTTTTGDDESGGFIEHKVVGTYRSRFAFGTDSTFLTSVSSEQAARTSFNFFRRALNAELFRAVTPHIGVSGRYSLEQTELFDELIPEEDQSLIDRLFPQVRLSILSGSMFWDRRNTAISPTKGGQITTSFDFAARQLGSEVGFVRWFVEGTIFKQRPRWKRLVFAARVQFGLARGFERTVEVTDENGQPVLGPDGQPVLAVVADLPASQRFFAGGSSTVRGFQVDALGVQEIMDDNGVSDGGNGMVIMNAEARLASGKLMGRNLTTVGFIDSGQVFDRARDLDFSRLRTTLGFGVRWDSPFGALRFDLGFKTDRFFFPKSPERRWAWHLSIGEVF